MSSFDTEHARGVHAQAATVNALTAAETGVAALTICTTGWQLSKKRVAGLQAQLEEAQRLVDEERRWASGTKKHTGALSALYSFFDALAGRSVRERDPACVARWPECAEGEYNPSCCRFPKSCSCTIGRGVREPEQTDG